MKIWRWYISAYSSSALFVGVLQYTLSLAMDICHLFLVSSLFSFVLNINCLTRYSLDVYFKKSKYDNTCVFICICYTEDNMHQNINNTHLFLTKSKTIIFFYFSVFYNFYKAKRFTCILKLLKMWQRLRKMRKDYHSQVYNIGDTPWNNSTSSNNIVCVFTSIFQLTCTNKGIVKGNIITILQKRPLILTVLYE